jgi:hypothetical protein
MFVNGTQRMISCVVSSTGCPSAGVNSASLVSKSAVVPRLHARKASFTVIHPMPETGAAIPTQSHKKPVATPGGSPACVCFP